MGGKGVAACWECGNVLQGIVGVDNPSHPLGGQQQMTVRLGGGVTSLMLTL
jgi:hypothetical protein